MVLAMFLYACSNRSVEQSRHSEQREKTAVLITDSVSTLISDSGITRYRIEAPQWLVYDKTDPPYQEFPKGIYLEQFDEDLRRRTCPEPEGRDIRHTRNEMEPGEPPRLFRYVYPYRTGKKYY